MPVNSLTLKAGLPDEKNVTIIEENKTKKTTEIAIYNSHSQKVKSRWRELLLSVRKFSVQKLKCLLGNYTLSDLNYAYKMNIASSIDRKKASKDNKLAQCISQQLIDPLDIKLNPKINNDRKIKTISDAYKYFILNRDGCINEEKLKVTLNEIKHQKIICNGEKYETIKNLMSFIAGGEKNSIRRIAKKIKFKDEIFNAFLNNDPHDLFQHAIYPGHLVKLNDIVLNELDNLLRKKCYTFKNINEALTFDIIYSKLLDSYSKLDAIFTLGLNNIKIDILCKRKAILEKVKSTPGMGGKAHTFIDKWLSDINKGMRLLYDENPIL